MKGQQEVMTTILMSGILIGVVGSVYFWGIPLIQKNKDVSMLETSEAFMRELDSKIKAVANDGGRDQIKIPVPGIVEFNPTTRELSLKIETQGTIYATQASVYLGKTTPNSIELTAGDYVGTWGFDDPALLEMVSTEISKQKYRNIYTLKYIRLENTKTNTNSRIKLDGPLSVGGLERSIVIESQGEDSELTEDGATLINSKVRISII